MSTSLITIELPLPETVGEIPGAIEVALRQWGVPLRWAITSIDSGDRVAIVEAVVTVL
jgi:hypothetical protein